jgi:hypothetical protein
MISLNILLLVSLSLMSQEIINFETITPREANIKSNTADLYSLYYDNQPSLLIHDKNVTSSSSKTDSRVVEVNVSKLNVLNDNDIDLSSIELIRVIYNQFDIPSELDLSRNSNLTNLKAIVFQCDFKCDPKLIEKLISVQAKNNIPIYYLISIPQ